MASIDVSLDQVKRAAEALKSYEKQQNPLHTDDDAGVYLGFRRSRVSLRLVPQPKFFEVPHAVFPPASKICIIVKDFDAEDKVTKQTYSELKMALNKVMPYSKLKKRYSSYDALRQLASKFDMFLVDERLLIAAYRIMGKHFAKKAHRPIPIKVENKTSQEILKSIEDIKRCAVYLPANGPTASIKVGRVGFTTQEITDNVLEAIEVIKTKLEDWSNLVHLHIKTPGSPSLTIYQVLPAVDSTTIVTKPAKKQKRASAQAEKDKEAEREMLRKIERRKKKRQSKKTEQNGSANGVEANGKEKSTKSKGKEIPKQVEKPPKEAETPKKAENTPKKAEKTAKKTEEVPNKAEATPKKVEKTPKKAENTTKEAETPKKVESTPKTPTQSGDVNNQNGTSNKKRKSDHLESPATPKTSQHIPKPTTTTKSTTIATDPKGTTNTKGTTPTKGTTNIKGTPPTKGTTNSKGTTPKSTTPKAATPAPQKEVESSKKRTAEAATTPTPNKKVSPLGSTKKARVG